ncbi:hypothetical protein BH11PSE2_BH11PSE2_09130 [soil metagenome]
MGEPRVHVLMYHSISNASGPTSIPAATFRMQLEGLAEAGYRVINVDEFVAWKTGGPALPARSALITFDDGFADFANAAFPILREHGFPAVVFIPTGRIGGTDNWESLEAPRALMDWGQVSELAAAGVEFGGHGVSHTNLTTLSGEALTREIVHCGEIIGERLGRPAKSFAAPFGATNRAVRAEIARHYGAAFGVRLGRAGLRDDLYDTPRLEMHYFRDAPRWRDMLQGRGETYFALRRGLRAVRERLGR